MLVVVKQTHEEKVAMYMKHSKKELIEMLISCNEALSMVSSRSGPTIQFFADVTTTTTRDAPTKTTTRKKK